MFLKIKTRLSYVMHYIIIADIVEMAQPVEPIKWI